MSSREYRSDPFLTVIGILALVIFAYVVLCHIGITPWIFFGEGLPLDTPLHWFGAVVVFFVPGLLLLSLRRVRVSMDDYQLHYRGVLRTITLPWEQIRKVRVRGDKLGPRDIQIWTDAGHVRLPFMFSHSSDLRKAILDNVEKFSGDHVIDSDTQRAPEDG